MTELDATLRFGEEWRGAVAPPWVHSAETSLEVGQAGAEVDVKDLVIQRERGDGLDAELFRLGDAALGSSEGIAWLFSS